MSREASPSDLLSLSRDIDLRIPSINDRSANLTMPGPRSKAAKGLEAGGSKEFLALKDACAR